MKAYGFSQLIYSLQVVEMSSQCLVRTERSSFVFFWIGYKSETERGNNIIKRSVLKNGYEHGGLNITDIECLNRSVKLRQFMRAWSVDHPISTIQMYCLENCGYSKTIMLEYERLTDKEAVVRSAQSTINILSDYMRESIRYSLDEFTGDTSAVYFCGITPIRSYLLRSGRLLLNGMAAELRRDEIISLHDLCIEGEVQMDRNKQITLRNVKSAFPTWMVELAGAYDGDNMDDSMGMVSYLDHNKLWVELNNVTTKQLQLTL